MNKPLTEDEEVRALLDEIDTLTDKLTAAESELDLLADPDDFPPTDPRALADWVINEYRLGSDLDEFLARLAENRRTVYGP